MSLWKSLSEVIQLGKFLGDFCAQSGQKCLTLSTYSDSYQACNICITFCKVVWLCQDMPGHVWTCPNLLFTTSIFPRLEQIVMVEHSAWYIIMNRRKIMTEVPDQPRTVNDPFLQFNYWLVFITSNLRVLKIQSWRPNFENQHKQWG